MAGLNASRGNTGWSPEGWPGASPAGDFSVPSADERPAAPVQRRRLVAADTEPSIQAPLSQRSEVATPVKPAMARSRESVITGEGEVLSPSTPEEKKWLSDNKAITRPILGKNPDFNEMMYRRDALIDKPPLPERNQAFRKGAEETDWLSKNKNITQAMDGEEPSFDEMLFRYNATRPARATAQPQAQGDTKAMQGDVASAPPKGRPYPKSVSRYSGAIKSAAETHGVDENALKTYVLYESGGIPSARTGKYRGMMQMSPTEWRKYGGGEDIYDPNANIAAAARKLKDEQRFFQRKYNRNPDSTELYLIHQQGVAGGPSHIDNPDNPAWLNMYNTAEGRKKGKAWAKKAVWGNIPSNPRKSPEFHRKMFPGGVETVASRDFVGGWRAKIEKYTPKK